MSVKGVPQLRARFRSLKTAFKPLGKAWAEETARIARTRAPVRTGRTRDSIKPRRASQTRASVVAWWGARFVEKGSKEHDIRPRKKSRLMFVDGGKTVFAKKVHKQRIGPRPFLTPSGQQALRDHSLRDELIKVWNEAG